MFRAFPGRAVLWGLTRRHHSVAQHYRVSLCSATQKLPLLQGVDLLSVPTTKELLSSLTVPNMFLNYKIFSFQNKVPIIQDYPGTTHPATRTLDNNSWGAARKDKMHNIISLTLFAVMGLNWKKIKELRPPREPQAEPGLGKFPVPRFRFSPCHTTSQSHSAIPAHDSSRRFCKQDKPPLNPFLQAEPQV